MTTTIGFGAAKEGTEAVHGNPLGDADLANVKKKFGYVISLNEKLSRLFVQIGK